MTDPHIEAIAEEGPTDAEKIAALELHYKACWACIQAGAHRRCEHIKEGRDLESLRLNPGAVVLTIVANAAAFPDRSTHGPSPIETRLLEAFWRVGLNPVQQYGIAGFIVDFAFPKARLVVEADGKDFHQDAEREVRRDEAIRSAGWHIVHFTGSQIWRDADACVTTVYRLARSSLV